MPHKNTDSRPTFSLGGLGVLCVTLVITLTFSCAAIRSFDAEESNGEVSAAVSAIRGLIEENEAIATALGLNEKVEG